jgi:hypothetical protein
LISKNDLEVGEALKIEGSHGCLRREERMNVSGGLAPLTLLTIFFLQKYIIIVVITTILT